MPRPASGDEQSHVQAQAGKQLLGKHLYRKRHGRPGTEHKPARSPCSKLPLQHPVRKVTVSRLLGKLSFLFNSALERPHLECCLQFCDAQYNRKRHGDAEASPAKSQKDDQRNGASDIQPRLFSHEKRRLRGILRIYINT